ncbi:hypothetical protein HY573_02635, partial [Candidatus Parcubacteria bacterium]|nr:hypothetical protein [Candidatus Parcubacteria bacterium]
AFAFAEDHDANGKKFTAIKPLHSVFVMDAVFATWKRGGPNAEAARTFLCDTVAGLIRKDRAEAEADFDRAVAVSADGRKIVYADWVAVMEPPFGSASFPYRRPITVFPPTGFTSRKILRAQPERGVDIHDLSGGRTFDPHGVCEVARGMIAPTATQVLVEVRVRPSKSGENKARVLMTCRRFCPDPLPEGGVEFPAEKQ